MLQKSRKGFTLLELLAVLIILSTLSLIAVSLFSNKSIMARQVAHDKNVEILTNQGNAYLMSLSAMPSNNYDVLDDMIATGYIREEPEYPFTGEKGVYHVFYRATKHAVEVTPRQEEITGVAAGGSGGGSANLAKPNVPTFNVAPSTPTNGNVTVTITYPAEAETKEYRIGGGEWIEYTSALTITSNTTVYARCFNAIGNMSDEASTTVNNIDKVSPTATINYSTTALTNGNVVATIVPSETVTLTNNSGNTSYTFTSNGNFTFSFQDAAGNTGSTVATVNNIDKVAPDAPIISVNTTEQVANVTVTITYPEDATTKYYKLGTGGTWTNYTVPVVVSSNCTIYAKGIDAATNESTESSLSINNIVVPPVFSGLGPAAFDHNYSTMYNGVGTVTWTGDLIGKVVTVSLKSNSSGNPTTFKVLNSSGVAIGYINPDTDVISTSFSTPSNTTQVTMKFVVPTNAASFLISSSNATYANVCEIEVASDLIAPANVTNTSYTSTDYSVTLNWTNPTDSDFNRVGIFRNGTFVGYATGGATTYTDKPLYSSMTYTYTIYAIDVTGNRSTGTSISATTQTPAIIWRGLGPAAFDHDYSTMANGVGTVTWTGDLIGKVVTVSIKSSSSSNATIFQVLNSSGVAINFINSDTDAVCSSFSTPANTTQVTMKIVVPLNAASFSISSSNVTYANVCEIEVTPDLIAPANVINTTYTSSDYSVTLNWTNPADSDFNRVAIYRNGTFVNYATGGATSYTDKPLYSATTYSYTIYALDAAGNRSTGANLNATTQTPAIIWRGLGPAVFDHDYNTSYNGTGTVTWTGNLIGKVVTVSIKSSSSYNATIFQVLNSSGVALNFINSDTDAVCSSFSTPANTSQVTMKIVVPLNAASFSITGPNVTYLNTYEIEVATDWTPPSDVTNLTCSTTDVSTTLNWTNPTDSDFNRVAIYRNGTFVSYATGGATTYTDKPLNVGTTFAYTVYTVDNTGNRSSGVNINATTITPEIVWSGYGINAFDHDYNTYVNGVGTVTWTGDLSGRTVKVCIQSTSSSQTMTFKMLDSSGTQLSFTDVNAGSTVSALTTTGITKLTKSVIVPSNAAKFSITSTNVTYTAVYEIEVQ